MMPPPKPPGPTQAMLNALKAAPPPRPSASTQKPGLLKWQQDQVQKRIDAIKSADATYAPEKAIQNYLVAREQPTLDALNAGGPPDLDTWAKSRSMFPRGKQTAPGQPDVKVYQQFDELGNPGKWQAPEGYDPNNYDTGFDQGKGEYRTYYDYPEYDQQWQGYGAVGPGLNNYVTPADRRKGVLSAAYGLYQGDISAPFGKNPAIAQRVQFGKNTDETIGSIRNPEYQANLRQWLESEAKRQGREIDSLIDRAEWRAQSNAG